MAKHEDKILVIIKRPGEEPHVENGFPNTLEALQQAVGGYIETVRIASGEVLILNEEGWILDLPINRAFGRDFAGTMVLAGVRGDEFCSLQASRVPYLLRSMGLIGAIPCV